MASIFRLPSRISRQTFSWRSSFLRSVSPVREFSQSSFPLLDPTQKFEEETLSGYSPDGFYPVKIGEVFQSRYQVVGKSWRHGSRGESCNIPFNGKDVIPTLPGIRHGGFKGTPYMIQNFHEVFQDQPGPPRGLTEWLESWEAGQELEDVPDDDLQE
ncbi:hypothetical protein E8E15_002216 [Penicillium rubens]|jgi:hypothetical protein|uniref:Pc13g01040 protein n=1 Tax=Penicillium rubens (strain ATCC 28089 / DSM 1075 / NRRL 1951 / Wisconsin 54-1255) TaxID=500485 RepID=B6H1L7_PENRW|nr:uncharacterized protein N7525_002889 [Penicillium rubens]KAI2707480.1 hypothetical protein CBS147354_9542 [Penicillium roqueforti]KAJ5276518.1 hypothetical protein N7524_002671 [Penicillium chrysogenum]CAP91173.1 Pc13g01040 [Penicillium rubens Wisconsin 54-1255]KAF3009013.1 hypothetical protein E8E15_002216 [Penicillium rubens]KAJ5837701.1 hypothetical protein N7525_002889 [Penicillium rubens]